MAQGEFRAPVVAPTHRLQRRGAEGLLQRQQPLSMLCSMCSCMMPEIAWGSKLQPEQAEAEGLVGAGARLSAGASCVHRMMRVTAGQEARRRRRQPIPGRQAGRQ